MFEISKDDVKQLNDVDLRELIALLCETEVSAKGLSSVGVKWGGSQNQKQPILRSWLLYC